MDLEEFEKEYAAFGSRQNIEIICEKCGEFQHPQKHKAKDNIRKNGGYFCWLCRVKEANPKRKYTKVGLRRIAEATSYKRSDETKKKMSDAKKAFFQTPAGKALKSKLARLAARGHAENRFENAKRNGWYESKKAGRVFFGSSYELRLCVELDDDDDVKTYATQIEYEYDGRSRCLDVLVTNVDGSKKAVEVKPLERLGEQANIDQVNDSSRYAATQGWDFDLYTEEHFGMTCRAIRDWADEFLTKQGPFDFVEFRKERNRQKAKKHYREKIAPDTVEIYCEYCKKTHTPLRKTHDRAIATKGRFICEAEGGSIAGKKPKPGKINPYAAESKKKCLGKYGFVLKYDEFGKDTSRRDGRADVCKKCRAEKAKAKYKGRK